MKPITFKNVLFAIPSICLCVSVNAEQETQTQTAKTSVDSSRITAYRAANTPVNYSYIALSAGKADYDNYNQKPTSLGISGQALLNEDFIFKMGYQAVLLDKDNTGAEIGYQSNKVNIGVGYRYPLFESTDIEVDGHLLYNWDSNDINDNTTDELGYLVGAYINQGIGDSFEAKLGVNYTSEYSQESFNIVVAATQYITEYVGIGIDGSFGSADDDSFSGDQSYLGAHLHLAFY